MPGIADADDNFERILVLLSTTTVTEHLEKREEGVDPRRDISVSKFIYASL